MMSRETIRSSCQIFEHIFEVFHPKAYYFQDFFVYLLTECLFGARITKNDMKLQRYNRLKIVLAEKERTSIWLSLE